MLTTVLVFVGILLVLVLAHELGHFWAARRLGVQVQEFAFGFPPRAASLKGKSGTLFSFNWLPLGGYVKLKGEDGEHRGDPDSFASQKAWRRAIVLIAGVGMNIVAAWLLLSIGLAIGVPAAIDDASQASGVAVQVVDVVPGSPAERAGIAIGDTIVSLNQEAVIGVTYIQEYVGVRAGEEVAVGLKRGDETRDVTVKPEGLSETGGRAAMGVSLVQVGLVRYPWYEAAWRGAEATYYLTSEILSAFGQLFKSLFVERHVPSDVSGPIGIAVLTGQVVDLGWTYVLQFAALLSINLAILNILPFPALDGGRLLFVGIEKLRGKPNDEKVEAVVHNVGFVILMVLVVLITYRDVMRFGGVFWQTLGRFFGA